MALFRRRSELRPRARELDAHYWQTALDVTARNWQGRRDAFDRASETERRAKGARDSWHTGLKYGSVQYSAGNSVAEIRATVDSVASFCEAWADLAFELPGPPPRLSDGNDYYISVLRLVGLAVGCGSTGGVAAVFRGVSRQGPDALFRALEAAHTSSDGSGAADAPTPRFARPLLQAVNQPADAARVIGEYPADWPTRMKPASWMGALDRVAPGDGYGAGFIGYWAFELAAIPTVEATVLRSIGSPFTPVDLLR